MFNISKPSLRVFRSTNPNSSLWLHCNFLRVRVDLHICLIMLTLPMFNFITWSTFVSQISCHTSNNSSEVLHSLYFSFNENPLLVTVGKYCTLRTIEAVFLQAGCPIALPIAQPTMSEHWRKQFSHDTCRSNEKGASPLLWHRDCKQFQPGIERVQALADILRSALCSHSNETRAPIRNSPNVYN